MVKAKIVDIVPSNGGLVFKIDILNGSDIVYQDEFKLPAIYAKGKVIYEKAG